ncbi:hypothetical protein B7494_g6061 [Chlorociboria aeruginascens]|nr:hypothetical protein B7494_g6061 [Chlorociboria aeruginascens]
MYQTLFNELYNVRDALYQPPGHKFQALRLPADGSPPSLVVLETIDVDTPTLFHEPDLTPFWGSGYTVDYRMVELESQRDEKFNGIYYRFKTTTDRLDVNAQFLGAKGDVLITKMHPLEFGRGAKALTEKEESNFGIMGSISEPLPASTPWVQTPCIRSAPLSRIAGCNVYLKLENLQPSGSFKSRGIANLMRRAIQSHGPSKPIHFYCSSGGNAGLACATAAIAFQRAATIVVSNLTSARMVEKLKTLGADVVQRGNGWDEADRYLREELLANDPNGVYVPPFDHKDLWEGHRTLVDELEIQMADESYNAIVCSVGGGGLFAGIMEGLSRHGRLHGGHSEGVKILAMETKGADSLSHSLRHGGLSRLGEMTSIATSLGATQVAEKAFEWAQREEVVSCVVSDAVAAMGSVHFADDERMLVETACGVSVALAYNGMLHSVLFPELSADEFAKLNIVLVICGGSNVTLQILESYRQKYSQDAEVLATFNNKRVE